MQTYEVLEKALALIEDERDWASSEGELPFRQCMATAIGKSEDWPSDADNRPARTVMLELAGTPQLCHFNDSHTHAEVIALFHCAIQAEKAKAGIYVELPVKVAEHV